MKRRIVLKNKKRFSVFLLSISIMIFAVAFTNTAYGYREPAVQTIQVKNGDTLWDIAGKYSKNEDIRKYIYKIKKINQLSGNDIYAGLQLKLPVQ